MGEREEESHVVATYREIATHFGLRGPDQGRTKAKRAGWAPEPQNHPADPLRVRVPCTAWEGASQARERGLSRRQERGALRSPPAQQGDGASQAGREPPTLPPEIPAFIKQLEAAHATLREQLARAEERAAEAQRELTRLRDQAAAAGTEAEARRREAERLRDELESWTAGGRLARALRALLFRRPPRSR